VNSPEARMPVKRKLLLLLIFLLVLAIGLIAAAPMLVSGPGRGLVVDRVNTALDGHIELDSLAIGWRGPQRIAGLRLFDPAGERVLGIGSIEIDGGLLALVRRPHCRGEIRLGDVDGDFVLEADGGSNLARAAGPAEPRPAEPAEPPDPASFAALRGMDCRIRLEQAGFGLRAPGMEPIRISALSADVRLDGLETLELTADAALTQGSTRGALALRAGATGLFDDQARLAPERGEFDFELDLTDFPVDMADRLAGLDGRLRALVGATANQRLEGQWSGAGGRFALDMESSGNASAGFEFEIRDGTAALRRPAAIALTVTPEAWPVLAPAGARLLQPFSIEARIEQLAFDPAESIAAVDARLIVGDIELQADDPRVGRLALRQTGLNVTSEDLRAGLEIGLETTAEQGGRSGRAQVGGRLDGFLADDLSPVPDGLRVDLDGTVSELPLAVLDQIAGLDGLLTGALGPRLNAEFHLAGSPAHGDGKFNLIARSEHLRTGISGTLGDDGLSLDTGRVGLQLQPAIVARFTDALTLTSAAGLDAQVREFRVPRRADALSWDDARIDVAVALETTRARVPEVESMLEMSGTLNAVSARLADGLAVEFDGRLGDGRNAGRMRASAALDGEMALRESVRIELSDFPVAMVDGLAGQAGRLVALLGDVMTAGVDVQPHADGAFTADLRLDAANARTRLSARHADGRVTVAPGAEMTLDLTPRAVAAFQEDPAFSLVRPARVGVRFDRLEATLADLTGPDGVILVARAEMPELLVQGRDGQTLRFADMQVLADGQPLGRRLDLRINADLAGGKFHSETTLSGLATDGDATMQTDTRFDDVPSALVLALADLDPALGPALGPAINARISGQVPGDLQVSAEGSNTRVSADARISADGVLELNRDAELTLNITPPLVDGYLARMHPFLNDVRSAEQPIRLQLSADGFHLPLTEYRPDAIRVRGRLEIGTLNMNRGTITLGLFGALQRLGGNINMGSTFQARFTPLEFSVRDGEVETNDLWMQMDNLMLGAQGRVRLPELADGVPWTEMLFAVPGQTLRGLPRIAGNIAADTILTTSSSGPLDQISPDFSGMFAGLVTQSAVERLAGDSEVGQVIGGLLGGRRERAPARDQEQVQGASPSRWPNMPPIDTGEDSP